MREDKPLIGLVHNALVPEALVLGKRLLSVLGAKKSSWVATAEDVDSNADKMDDTRVIVTVGGDGTILRTVRLAAPKGVPIVSVNMGRVGFMTELSTEQAEPQIREYVFGSPQVEERMMLTATRVSGSGETNDVHALNDVVVSRGQMARLLQVETFIDGAQLTTYRADGVVVATATGSTGYALSVGGPVLHPRSKETVLVPIAGHMCLQTPLVLTEESVVELHITNDARGFMSVDGFIAQDLRLGDRIRIKRSPYVGRLLRMRGPESFYTTLTQRLGVVDR
ncbi:MAG: NAD(+)/NADH kinase [Chloroflexi bacterium]|nr:NAD(+)/NADH kinase [Chloroflexota bacterium]